MAADPQAPRITALAQQGALALRRQVDDLFALLELPARWRGREPREIAERFIEELTRLLRLDVALIRIQDAEGLIDQRFPPELASEAVLSAAQAGTGASPLLFELPRPNTVGRTTVRLVTATPLGEQGVVVVGSWRQNFPTAHELQLFETAANQAALAMQSSREARAQRSLAEERSRLERANSALARLHAIADGLSRAHTAPQVAQVILSEGLAAVGARAGGMFLVDDTQSELRPAPSSGAPAAPLLPPRRIPVHADLPLATAFREKRAVYLTLTEDLPPESYGLPHHRARAVAAVPLMVDASCLGVLSLGFDEPRAFTDDERAFIQAIAHQTAQACDRARLLEAEQRARLEAEQRQQRADFLSETSAILGSSLDFAESLQRVAALVVPRFADWVMLQVSARASERLEETSTVAVHRDASCHHLAREYGQGLLSSRGRSRSCVTNNSVIAPIVARGQHLGVLVFGSEEPGLYGPEMLGMVEELGFRTGVAIENAWLYEAAREADRRKDEFLAMLGHELRNPLSPILTALHLMRMKDPLSLERERTIVERQIEHMVRLVDDLLDVSRITRGKLQLKRELLDMRSCLLKAVEMTAPLLERRSHHLELGPLTEPLLVEGDAARLSQVVANLLNNAAKYTDPGGCIRVSLGREDGKVVLRVRDSGTGISPEMLPKIFGMFVQDGRAIDRSQGGLGLGLAIVRNLLELHDGSVSAHSEGVGRGSEFVVRLPLAKTSSRADRADRAEPGPEAAGPSAGDSSQPLRILIVDDNQDAVELLAEALASAGFTLQVAFDGPTGLESAAGFRPDVAVLDVGLPVMDGYELAEKIRALPGLRDVKLIALTGYGQDSDRRRALDAGFDLHMVKPVDLAQLRGTLRGLAERVTSIAE